MLLQRKNHGAAQGLSAWLDTLRNQFSGRILPVTDVVAFEWGRIAAIRTRSPLDAQIAATAMVHGLTLVTRNTVDFEDTGVDLLNPWAEDEIRPA